MKNAVKAGLGCSLVLAGAVRDDIAAARLSMVTLKDVEPSKDLYAAFQTELPGDAMPVRLAEFLA